MGVVEEFRKELTLQVEPVYTVDHFGALEEFLRPEIGSNELIDVSDEVAQFCQMIGAHPYGSAEYLGKKAEWAKKEPDTILVVGSGKAGQQASEFLVKEGFQPFVITSEDMFGGMAVEAINSDLHPSPKTNMLDKGAKTFIKPEVESVFGIKVYPDKLQEFCKIMGFKGVIWCGGAVPKKMEGVNYEAQGVYTVTEFLGEFNKTRDYEGQSLSALAQSAGYKFGANGVALPTFIQAGGKSGEDIALADVAMRIVLALKSRGVPDGLLDRINFKKFFEAAENEEGGLDALLLKVGLSGGDIGETVILYHGDLDGMNLFPPLETEIDARMKKVGTKEDGTSFTRKEVAEIIKKENLPKVPQERARWAKAYGVRFEGSSRVQKLEDSPEALIVEIGDIVNKEEVVGTKTEFAGLFISSTGYTPVELDTQGAVPVEVAGMSAGTGALPDSVYTANRAVKNLKKRVAEAGENLPVLSHALVMTRVELVREKARKEAQKRGIKYYDDPIARMFRLGPRELMLEWRKKKTLEA